MKNFFKFFILVFTLLGSINIAAADIMPAYIGDINKSTIGVYQATNNFKIFSEPSSESKVLFDVKWTPADYLCENISAGSLFVIFLQKKNLAFLSVTDENDDETWIQIVYNQNGIKYGWVKKDEDFRYMNWRTFFNIYGRKYGLYFMKDAPQSSKILYGSNSEENQKQISMFEAPKKVKLQSVSGNWLLAIANDIDGSQKIGWLKWRNLNGEIFLFPNIK